MPPLCAQRIVNSSIPASFRSDFRICKPENTPVVTKDDDSSGSDRIQESVHVVRDALEAVLDGRGRLGRLVVAELGRAEDAETALGKGGNLCDRVTQFQLSLSILERSACA